MPLPLPNLDTRRWTDLVDEGRALIPRYSPGWTDHNVHDPGITVMELLAWLVEQETYRVNRIPDRHRRKFLALAGFPVEPPRPALVALAFASGSAVNLPAGFTVSTIGSGGEVLPFRLTGPLHVTPVGIRVVQVFDGTRYADRTRAWRSGAAFTAWGDDPAPPSGALEAPALYVGLDAPLQAGAEHRFWLSFAGGRSGPDERRRIAREAAEQEALCRPIGPANVADCGGEPPAAEPPQEAPAGPPYHVRTAWEYYDGASWQPLTALDDTRGLTLDGALIVTGPAAMQPLALGAVAEPWWYVRCRLVEGRPDAAPTIAGLAIHAVVAEQASDARSTFLIARGVIPAAGEEPVPGQRQRLRLAFDSTGSVSALAATAAGPWPETLVLDYRAATATSPGSLTCLLALAGHATGLPGQALVLPGGQIAHGSARLWTLSAASADEWTPAPDLDAATPDARDATLDPATGALTFGDGAHGRVPTAGSAVMAAYATTVGVRGRVTPSARWHVSEADDLLNAALGPAAPADLAVVAALPVGPGSTDDIATAAGRAAEVLWAHERLLDLASPGNSSLDQAGRAEVLARRAPPRATTLLDYERIALEVPGTAVRRARAWASIDPRYPCLRAPGTVSVAIVPELAAARPEPTPELLESVRRYLHRRRTIGTRLVVVGPEYVEVSVRAKVHALPRADATRTRNDILEALALFLHPMRGGPAGRGWPFGRDVYRSEVLQVIDNVAGVDHVIELELFAGAEEVSCGNVCIGRFSLTTSGQHEVEVS